MNYFMSNPKGCGLFLCR